MQITEFFTSGLERALKEYSRGELSDFLPDSHTSLPDLQEHLLYLCAGGHRTLKQPDSFSFQDVNGFLLLYIARFYWRNAAASARDTALPRMVQATASIAP